MDVASDTATLETVARLRALVEGRLASAGLRDDADAAGLLDGLEALDAELRARDGALRRLEQRYHEAVAQAQAERLQYRAQTVLLRDGILLTDAHGVIEEANPAAVRLLRTPAEFLRGKPLMLFVAGEFHFAFAGVLEQVVRHSPCGVPRTVHVRLRGEPPVYATALVTAVADHTGRMFGLHWLLQDTTVNRHTESALRAQRDLVDSLFAVAPALIVALDAAGRILRANPSVAALSGHAEAKLQGRDWLGLFVAPREQPRARDMLDTALLQGQGADALFTLADPTGAPRAVVWSARALPWSEPGGPAVLLVGHDVTELRAAQEQAVRAERLAAIGQMVAGLAHESRNALQRIQACLEMLHFKLRDRPDVTDLVSRAEQAQGLLLRLFDDVRAYAAPIKLEAGPCDLVAVWRDAWANVAPADARLHEEAPAGGLWCNADAFRIGQVFRNVFDNACAAASPADVTVRVCHGEGLEGPTVEVYVRDHGPGLSAEQKARVFEPFYTTKVRGTGLGMPIVKRIVEAHGGRVAVCDAPGGGAEVRVVLPCEPPPAVVSEG